MPLVWIAGAAALKCIIGFWPHFQMQAEKGAGKTTLLGALGATTGFTMLSSQQAQTAYRVLRSEEHTSELQSLMRISYAVFCLKKKKKNIIKTATKKSQTHSELTTQHCLSYYISI